MSFLQLLLKPGKRTLADVVLKLPHQGVGSRVTRQAWAGFGDSYWDITKVVPKEQGAEVWGVLTWRGQQAEEAAKVRGADKPVWRWVPSEQQQMQLTPLVRELQRQQQLQQREQQAAESSS